MKYVAVYHHSGESFHGTLTEIHDAMEEAECDPDDYDFYEVAQKVKVVYEKKLVVVPVGVKK